MTEDHRRLAERSHKGFCSTTSPFLKDIVERVLQELLEAEMTEHVGAAPYERSERRKGHRNGHKPRGR